MGPDLPGIRSWEGRKQSLAVDALIGAPSPLIDTPKVVSLVRICRPLMSRRGYERTSRLAVPAEDLASSRFRMRSRLRRIAAFQEKSDKPRPGKRVRAQQSLVFPFCAR
ncbi:hypothetical protein KM043_002645 [Ampulex compressa]|nr:hypothetical protein KM043_002645 [Ampulex compressa]